MNYQDKKIFDEFARRLRHHIPQARLIAFGSRTRGDNTEESDFDICIVTDHTDSDTYEMIRNIAWEVGFENERIITTVILNDYQFEHGPMSESTLVRNIRLEGIAA